MNAVTATDLHADLTFGRDWPSADLFAELARDRRVIPVVRRLLADAETPLGVYRKLAKDRPGTFLLESAEHGGVWSRYSIVGAASRATLSERDGQAHWIGEPPVGVPTDGAPTQALADTLDALRTPRIPVCHRSPAAWSGRSPTTPCAASRSCRTPVATTWVCRRSA